MKCKIGKLKVSYHKFPIWIENKWGKDIFEINIYCESNVADILMDSLIDRKFSSRFSGDTKTVAYKFHSRDMAVEELNLLVKDKLAEIDFNKLDDFLLKVDKKFVVERLTK